MASHGARASGGDGGDFTHRERVATQYKESAAYKQRFGTVSLAHSVIVMAATGNVRAHGRVGNEAVADRLHVLVGEGTRRRRPTGHDHADCVLPFARRRSPRAYCVET